LVLSTKGSGEHFKEFREKLVGGYSRVSAPVGVGALRLQQQLLQQLS